MATGNVKWFNPTKGYGFIQPQGGGKDVFVHISAVERAGLSTLNEGQVVQYEVVANRGKESLPLVSDEQDSKRLLMARCAVCHSADLIVQQRLTLPQWIWLMKLST